MYITTNKQILIARVGTINTIKLKVEKDGEIIQEDLTYSKDNLSIMLKKYDIAVKTLFPNRITDEKFKELRLLNDKHVLLVHGSGFSAQYGKGHFRMVFLPSEKILTNALTRIDEFLQQPIN